MKKTFTLISILLTIASFAQKNSFGIQEYPEYVTDSIYQYIWDNTGQVWLLDGKIADMSYSDYRLNSEIEYNRVGNDWQRSKFHTLTFDESGRCTLELFMTYNNSTWVNDIMIRYAFDGSGNETEKTIQLWNSLFWVNDKRFVSTYDGSGNKLSDTTQTGNSSNEWTNVNLITYTYDNNKLITEISEQWYSGAWVKYNKKEYTYENGRVASKTEQVWVNNAWGNDVKTSYTYNTEGKIKSAVVQRLSNGTWNNRSLTEYTYNSAGNLELWLFKEWDGAGWFDTQKQTYQYDDNKNMTHMLFQIIKGDTWKEFEEEWFAYNNSSYLTSSSHKSYDAETVYGDSTQHYLRSVVGIEENAGNDVTIYPNPTTDKIAINSDKPVKDIEVLSVDGTVRMKQPSGRIVDMGSLPSGTYIVRYSINGRLNSKVVIRL